MLSGFKIKIKGKIPGFFISGMISKNKIKNISSYTFQKLIVIGGSWTLDSTETFDSDLGNWVTSGAKMPRPMDGLRAANIDGRVLIFGKLIILHFSYTRS